MRYTIFNNIQKYAILECEICTNFLRAREITSSLMVIIIKDSLVRLEYHFPKYSVDSVLIFNDFPDRKILIEVVLIQNNNRQDYSLKYSMFSSFLYSLFMPKKEDTTTTTLLLLDSSVLSFLFITTSIILYHL